MVILPPEFKVNEFLSLRLEEKDIGFMTVIYVNGRRFDQCKFLLLNIPIKKIASFDEIDSIDEAAERLDKSLEDFPRKIDIPPEIEFWGHCSNLQVWFENDYDTRLLKSDLAFPLLEGLAEAGDPIAKRVFKEEIAKRYLSGHPSVMKFLILKGYLNHLSLDEKLSLVEELDSRSIHWDHVVLRSEPIFFIDHLNLSYKKIERISEIKGLEYLKNLEDLDLRGNQISEIKGLENLKNLKILILRDNQITEIKGLENLTNLETLYLNNNRILKIKGLENLTSLKSLYLNNNQISEIKDLENLRNLRTLTLDNNQIAEIKGLKKLTLLKSLALQRNKIRKIKGFEKLRILESLGLASNNISDIEGLENLLNLRTVSFASNKISRIKGLSNLKKLEKLHLHNNQISEIKGLENLKNLERLYLHDNYISEIKGIEHLTKLEQLTLSNNQITENSEINKLIEFQNLKYINYEGNPVYKKTHAQNTKKMKK